MEKILREKEVEQIIGVTRVTIWRWCGAGNFPKPIKLGENSKGWLESEIQNWIQSKRRASRVSEELENVETN